MSNRTLILIAAAVALYLLWKHQQEQGDASAQPPAIVPQHLLDWSPSPMQRADYWSGAAGFSPSQPGAQRAGGAAVTPGTMTQWLGSVFPGVGRWDAPNAATDPVLQPAAGPPGAFVTPGPVSPQQPTPQSAVQSTSPYLPQDFTLETPVSSSPWASDLTLHDPLSVLLVGSGDYIDAVVVPAGVGA